jgi:hypothetical protein
MSDTHRCDGDVVEGWLRLARQRSRDGAVPPGSLVRRRRSGSMVPETTLARVLDRHLRPPPSLALADEASSIPLAGSRIIGSARGKCEEFRSHLPRHPLSLRQASEGSSEDPAPKPRSLACFERRKPPLGAVFLVFDLRRAPLGVGQGRNKAAPTAVRAGAPGIARALSSLGPGS